MIDQQYVQNAGQIAALLHFENFVSEARELIIPSLADAAYLRYVSILPKRVRDNQERELFLKSFTDYFNLLLEYKYKEEVKPAMATEITQTEGRSKNGLDITLIDSIGATASVLKERGLDTNDQATRAALVDLLHNENVTWLLAIAGKITVDSIEAIQP